MNDKKEEVFLREAFSCFNWDAALNRMRHYAMQRRKVAKEMEMLSHQTQATEAVWHKFCNQCKYPLICGKRFIYQDQIWYGVRFALTIVSNNLNLFARKRYMFNWLMVRFLKRFIPWAHDKCILPYNHFNYSRYISTTELYNGPVGCNGRPLLTSFERFNTNTLTVIKKED